ncbi:hypothetical protein EUGRSUZ_A01826 [Eucalyptus grandis]|uniref:Uncharacterized protein n=2 Tax=Eucalyptus grandis TaxID=71139 RepID=A0ACC3M4D0_EUCGR|nr:hypothetical protein EUGRSUZ_A01826 [Eucalyptus grandis]
MANREEESPVSPALVVVAPSLYPLILRIMSKRLTWACFFMLVYAVLLSSTWNSHKWPTLYASVLLDIVFGVLSMVAALVVAILVTLVTWITVVVLLAFFRKPKRMLVHEGSKITKEIVGLVGKVLLKEGNVMAAVCAVVGYFALVKRNAEGD